MKGHTRRKRLMAFFKFALRGLLKAVFNFSYDELPSGEGPYIVLANHTIDYDPLLMGVLSKEYLYFVASEHVFRAGFLSRLLVWAFDPIPRAKANAAGLTVIKIMRRLKKGYSVCIFAEGTRSFHGRTMPILPSTGALVQRSGATLVTFKFRGGYFTQPRWGFGIRRGKMTGHLIQEYKPSQLADMSIDDINAAINADLFEDAYTSQAEQRIAYKGKRRAEGLETVLFICPSCRSIGTLTTKDNSLSCSCGLHAVYTVYGYLEYDTSRSYFTTITDWDTWQKHHLARVVTQKPAMQYFFDLSTRLLTVDKHHHILEEKTGSIAATAQEIMCCEKIFRFEDITDMALYGRNALVFSTNGTHYEIKGGPRFCGWKYFVLYDIIKTDSLKKGGTV